MNILPGEPVPPGFEDEVNRVAEIQQAIDQYKGNALVGLEYTVELYEEDREPGYVCLLCDKRGDPRTIMQHWTSFNHRIKYLEKHFPSAVREFNPVKYKPNSHSIMISIVQSLSEAIEDHHGRLTLSVCNSDEFRRDRNRIQKEINEKFHIDERNGPNFLNVIDRTLWETKKQSGKPIDHTLQITIKAPKRAVEDRSNRDELDEISSEDESGGHDPNKKSKVRAQSPAYRVLPRVRRSPPFEEERENMNDKKLPTPKELSLQASHIAQERYKWEKYRCMLEIHLKQMEKIQQDYEKNPEKHPLYPDEWKKFWNRRYKELQAEKKIDPNKYDYKPEWIKFWTKRMQDLFKDEVEKKKKEIKLKLGLPENAEEKVEQLKEKYKVQVSRNAPSGPTPHSNIERNKSFGSSNNSKAPSMAVIDISDDDSIDSNCDRSNSRNKSRRSRSISPRSRRHESKRTRHRSDSRSRSPHSDDFDAARRHYKQREVYERHMHTVPQVMRAYPGGEYYVAPPSFVRSRYPVPPHYSASIPSYRIMDSHQYPKYERSPSPLGNNKDESASKAEPEPEDDGPLTVVAVLRLLTALEEHLGSLGPKVVDMLGKALALEKVKANSADEMLINEDNCVFFETIKEKLKGLLIADVLDEVQKVKAVKRAVKNIAAIVHQVNEKGKSASNSTDVDDHKADEDTLNKKKQNQMPQVKDLPFDRQVVATKLAAALVMQGREDVSTEDMDKLIYIFLLMAKLTKDKVEIDDRPLYTKDILPELGIVVPKPAPVPVPTLNPAIPTLVDDFFENEVNALVQEVEEEMSNDTNEKNNKNDAANASMLESLTDSDLQTLLQNFKHLSTEEQHHLIAHLKKLETADPARVEKLRKFVNLADMSDVAATSSTATAAVQSKSNDDSSESIHRRSSSKRYDDSPIQTNDDDRIKYSADEVGERRGRVVNVSNPNKFSLDDEEEDDDYNFEDVFKAASSNVQSLSEERTHKSKSDSKSAGSSVSNGDANTSSAIPISSSSATNALTFNPAGLNISLNDTQNLIANLMGSLQQSNSGTSSSGGNPIKTITPKSQQQQQQHHHQQQQQQHQQQQQAIGQSNVPFYQQQQPQQGFGDFNQMNNAHAGYYNSMAGGYNNGGGGGYAGYQQQWGNAQQMQQQPFGMQNFMTPQQQQQQQMGYNMYGRGGN